MLDPDKNKEKRDQFLPTLRVGVGPQHKTQRGIIGKIAHHPVQKNEQLVLDAENKHEVDEHPGKPCKKTLKMEIRQIDNGLSFPYGGHGTLVVILEFNPGPALQFPFRITGQIDGLCQGYISQLRMTVRVFGSSHPGNVADSVNAVEAFNLAIPVCL